MEYIYYMDKMSGVVNSDVLFQCFFNIQLADDKSCAVDGETYDPFTQSCNCGSASSCAIRIGKLNQL